MFGNGTSPVELGAPAESSGTLGRCRRFGSVAALDRYESADERGELLLQSHDSVG